MCMYFENATIKARSHLHHRYCASRTSAAPSLQRAIWYGPLLHQRYSVLYGLDQCYVIAMVPAGLLLHHRHCASWTTAAPSQLFQLDHWCSIATVPAGPLLHHRSHCCQLEHCCTIATVPVYPLLHHLYCASWTTAAPSLLCQLDHCCTIAYALWELKLTISNTRQLLVNHR